MMDSIDVQSQNLALVTLKERCHFLKQQLQNVDAENIKLKVQITQSKIADGSMVVNENAIVSEVERLRKEKEQLSSQVSILATENSNMWARLSRLTVVNRNLTRRFTKISDKLEKYGISSLMESESESCSNFNSKDIRKDLEEMSLKLINNIKLEKTELESQYAQMVELQQTNTDVVATDLAFSSLDIGEDALVSGVRKHATRLNEMKHSLKLQQEALINALAEMKNMQEKNQVVDDVAGTQVTEELSTDALNSDNAKDQVDESVHVAVGEARRSEETVHAVTIQPTIENRALPSSIDQVCPMCGNHVPGPAEIFYEHVSNHFDDDENSQPSLSSFVHVPNQS